jgi:hypothetical protein
MNIINKFSVAFVTLMKKFTSSKFSMKAIFLFMGISSTLWFLIRVIPKPQRANYPCMKAAAPIMSGFITYLLTLGGIVLFFKKAINRFNKAKYFSAVFSIIIAFGLVLIFNFKAAEKAFSDPNKITFTRGILPDGPNNPMGTSTAIFPGRVAWVRNPDATDENCPNTISNGYFMAKNNNQAVINNMADQALLSIGGKTTVKDSWDAIFKSFNKKKSGNETGYTEGQTIFIKVNNGQAGWAISMSNLAETGTTSATGVRNAAMSNTTPAAVLAIVRQLVDSVGVPQDKIYIGEPMTHVYKSLYDLIHASYPNVKVLDKEDHTNLGRTTSSGWHDNAIVYSDKGDDMPDAISDALMNEMYDADYMINMAALKAHARGGVSLCAKLHFGSHGDHGTYGYGSFYLHAGNIATVDNDVLDQGVRGDYGMYRVTTDLMGHEKLGRNTVLFIVDGLWGGIEATDMPVKWKTAPFNNDFPNSLFVSQDEVAVESVCIDFLRAEANVNPTFKDRPFFPAVDDYLHQAADKANWPAGLTYDPEGDGTPMPTSLGVHEHWNNDTDKKYTKNIDPVNGKGIELKSITLTGLLGLNTMNQNISGLKVFPNPCSTESEITFSLKSNANVEFSIVNMEGKIVKTMAPANYSIGLQTQKLNTSNLTKGNYIVVMKSTKNSISETQTTKIIVN